MRASERGTDIPIKRVGIRGGALGVNLHIPAHRVVGRVVRVVGTRGGSAVVLKTWFRVYDLPSCAWARPTVRDNATQNAIRLNERSIALVKMRLIATFRGYFSDV
jgi:hypothetical protein